MSRLHADLTNPTLGSFVGQAIVSSPVEAETADHLVMSIEERAANTAAAMFPFHTTVDIDRGTNVEPSPCCDPDADVEAPCERNRRLVREALVASAYGLASEVDHDLEMRSDPVVAMAHDHIRLAKPNRTRSRS